MVLERIVSLKIKIDYFEHSGSMQIPFSQDEKIMTFQEPEKLLENQNPAVSVVDIEKCKLEKIRLDNENAKFVLKKQMLPITKWYLENLKDGSTIDVEVGDQIELIDLEQSFEVNSSYKGSTRNTVLEIGPKFVRLLTPDSLALLISENSKILGINKPLYKGEFSPIEQVMRLLHDETASKNANIQTLIRLLFVIALIALIAIVIIVLL